MAYLKQMSNAKALYLQIETIILLTSTGNSKECGFVAGIKVTRHAEAHAFELMTL
jgi:hypothetical protein